jgi:hypothetical protein
MGTASDLLLSGSVVGWDPEYLEPGPDTDASGWRHTLRVEGWQRLLALSYQQPGTGVAVDTVAGTTVSAEVVTPISSIESAMAYWAGPPITLDLPLPGREARVVSVGQSRQTVLDGIASAWGSNDVYWLDGAKCLHWRPGFRGGVAAADLRAPSRYIAPFFLTRDFTATGGVVPTSLRPSGEGGHLREGAFVNGPLPELNFARGGGPAYAGWEMASSPTRHSGEATWAQAMAGRTSWRMTLTAVLPPGSPIPPLGALLGVDFAPYVTGLHYYLIRAVRGNMKANGQGIDGVEWTLDLGDSERRSYVFEADSAVQATAEPKPKPVTTLECSQIVHLGIPSEQYVYAWPEDDKGNRVRLDSGTVEWTVSVTPALGSESLFVGGSSTTGWTIAEGASTDIVVGDDLMGTFAYCTLVAADPALATDVVYVKGRLL